MARFIPKAPLEPVVSANAWRCLMYRNATLFVAGHRGMVGSALVRRLLKIGVTNPITATKGELDLRDPRSVNDFFKTKKPDLVLLAAAKVGGIKANQAYPVDFLHDNLMIQNNVFHASHVYGIKKLLFLGSSCVYPRECPQPMKEEFLLTGPLEPTNEGYALAKIAGLKMAAYYFRQHGLKSVCLMPPNLYGPGDSFDLERCHVVSALVRRFVDAAREERKTVTLWGTGSARRELMHVDDLARLAIDLFQHVDAPEIMNVGTGEDVSIKDLAHQIAAKAGYRGALEWDASKPDGMPRKLLDISRLKAAGFQCHISLDEGIDQMISLYKSALPLQETHTL